MDRFFDVLFECSASRCRRRGRDRTDGRRPRHDRGNVVVIAESASRAAAVRPPRGQRHRRGLDCDPRPRRDPGPDRRAGRRAERSGHRVFRHPSSPTQAGVVGAREIRVRTSAVRVSSSRIIFLRLREKQTIRRE